VDPFPAWSQRLRASDPTACGEVFEALHPALLRYALYLTRDEATAYDVVQEAFVKLWQVRETLDPERSMKVLLYRIVRNLSLNDLRMKRHEPTVPTARPDLEAASTPTPEEAFDARVLSAHLRRWIDTLPPRRREAFQLSRYEGLSHDEIARVMNLTPRTVTNHIMLALQYLRDRLRAFQASGA
jgi:RNA polymerase sigma-70 factor (family 1)